jgi:predicted nuclease of predicted toxin-antitoxin system
MKMRFLLDEHLSMRLAAAIQHRNPLIDVLRIGDSGAPPLATLDPAILDYLATSQRALITRNRRSMT